MSVAAVATYHFRALTTVISRTHHENTTRYESKIRRKIWRARAIYCFVHVYILTNDDVPVSVMLLFLPRPFVAGQSASGGCAAKWVIIVEMVLADLSVIHSEIPLLKALLCIFGR